MKIELLLPLLFGCTGKDADRGDIEEAKIFAVGDSIFEWSLGDLSAPEVVGSQLQKPVYNAAISGAMMSDDSWNSIPNQYQAGNWDWVILDGGANDLNDLCGCQQCDEVQADIDQVLRDFVAARRSEGIGVVIWGYYGIPTDAEYGFDRCGESVTELSQRQQSIADTDEGVYFVDGRTEITGEDLSFYDDDNIHPSMLGSETIGVQIATAIQAVQ
jgi:acyl-CoA thioesterase I